MKKSFGLIAALIAILFAALLLPGCPTEPEDTNPGNNNTGGATMTWSGDWIRISDNKYRSNPIEIGNTIERLTIVAANAGTVTIQLISSCGYDNGGGASALDTGISSDYEKLQMMVFGTDAATYTYTVPAGAHWIQFAYQKNYYDSYGGSDSVTVEIIASDFTSSSTPTPDPTTNTRLKVQNESSFNLGDIKWSNKQISEGLYPAESATVDVAEGTGYLFFTKYIDGVGFSCRTQEVIAVTKDETTNLTLTNNTVVVDIADTANLGPLGTIAPRETKLTIRNQSSLTLVDVKWGNTVVSASLAPSESATVDVTEGTGYLFFTKGNANGLKCRTKDEITVAKNETPTQTMLNTTVVIDLDDTANEASLETIARRETKLTIRNQSSVTLADIRWSNTVVSASLAPSESITVDVSEGTSYLYFTKGNANGLKCRTKETIVVARHETTTQTMVNTTVVVDLDDTTNEGPLETIAPPVSSATMTWSEDWIRVSDTIYRSNAIGHNDNTIERLNITASGSGSITIQLTASSEGADFGYASYLDTGVSTSYSDYVMRVSGTQVATYTYTIPAGSHWIQFMYQKDGSYTSGNDQVTVEIVSTTFTAK